jgi:hypothetical protein
VIATSLAAQIEAAFLALRETEANPERRMLEKATRHESTRWPWPSLRQSERWRAHVPVRDPDI